MQRQQLDFESYFQDVMTQQKWEKIEDIPQGEKARFFTQLGLKKKPDEEDNLQKALEEVADQIIISFQNQIKSFDHSFKLDKNNMLQIVDIFSSHFLIATQDLRKFLMSKEKEQFNREFCVAYILKLNAVLRGKLNQALGLSDNVNISYTASGDQIYSATSLIGQIMLKMIASTKDADSFENYFLQNDAQKICNDLFGAEKQMTKNMDVSLQNLFNQTPSASMAPPRPSSAAPELPNKNEVKSPGNLSLYARDQNVGMSKREKIKEKTMTSI